MCVLAEQGGSGLIKRWKIHVWRGVGGSRVGIELLHWSIALTRAARERDRCHSERILLCSRFWSFSYAENKTPAVTVSVAFHDLFVLRVRSPTY